MLRLSSTWCRLRSPPPRGYGCSVPRSRPLSSSALLGAYSDIKFSRSPSFGSNQKPAASLPPLGLIAQPTPSTHPHLMKPGEVTPGISELEYELRRAKLMSECPDGSVVVVAGYGLRYMTNGIFYPFHQNTNLLYLCGFMEPDSALILEKSPSLDRGFKMTMFVRPRDKRTEIWDGPRAGIEGAESYFGADEAHPIETLPSFLEHLVDYPPAGPVFTDLPITASPPSPLDGTHIRTSGGHAASAASKDNSVTEFLRHVGFRRKPSGPWPSWESGKVGKEIEVKRLSPILNQLRLWKSDAEAKLMRECGRMAGRAFVETMRATRPGMTEHDLYAIVDYESRRRGATCLSYVPVVAGGKNALILHYTMNTQILKDGDLVLMDAGAEFGGYASDITRTWPVNGKFTSAQADVYESVLKVQKHCINLCTESHSMSLDEIQNISFDLLRLECQRMFKRTVDYLEMNALYPHHISHWIGLDVHDIGTVSRGKKLEAGMTVTIEPGLYIPDSPRYPPEYRGIGIRIEDDVLVGTKTPIVLTAEAPKEIVDIEHCMSRPSNV
ncbi:peptidase M24, structural domain-containing protein [Polychytrium aggregatum]|uniref:peptidase M24, structural domain-containing protein n=1 Tax=Polychytrium aggregatum TaxID=110093 RepID=UPI0022FED26B|nr:peptidase M24, structural domain-containing protein [Polychytrium aggregatum]KAI9206845.1 peptidase M24, structural domain-containing protein [Polychytrium aggregatum]